MSSLVTGTKRGGGGGGRSVAANLRAARGSSFAKHAGSATKTLPPPEVQAAGAPVSGGSNSHRNLKKHLVSASELAFDEAIAADAPTPDDTIDLVSIARFPPGIAAILRKRTVDAFAQALQAWDAGVSNVGQSDTHGGLSMGTKELSSRGALGLSIQPVPAEDYRIFDVLVDIMSQSEVSILQTWRPDFDIDKHPPLVMHSKPETSGPEAKAKAKTKGKAKSSSNESSLITKPMESTNVKAENWDIPLGTIKLIGLLTELPSLIEGYKTLDFETMVKAADISQILICCFPEDAPKHFPVPLNTTPGSEPHECCERFAIQAESVEDPDDLLFDNNHDRLSLGQCPWLWPSGITPPLYLHRERRQRNFDIYTKQEVQLVETEMISIMKKCPQEKAQLEVASALECFLQHEALQKDSSVPNSEQVLTIAPDVKIVHVVTDRHSNIFDDPDDNLSDELFGEDFQLTEADIMDAMRGGTSSAAQKKRRDKRPDQIQAAGGVMAPGQGQIGSLEDEFDELAQMQVRKQRADQLDQEFEDEFFGEAVIEDNASSVVVPHDTEIEAGFTSMKILTKSKNKSKKK